MNAIRYVLRPAMTGPCSASPVHRSLTVAASNRPKAPGPAPSGRVFSSRRAKCRCSVRAEGATDTPCSVRIATTCAAVRAGTSRLSATASSNTVDGVRGCACRAEGTNASNPPVRQARTHRSRLTRETMTLPPNGPVCSRPARSRTSTPRARVLNEASAASRISAYRNNATSLARSARRAASSPGLCRSLIHLPSPGSELVRRKGARTTTGSGRGQLVLLTPYRRSAGPATAHR